MDLSSALYFLSPRAAIVCISMKRRKESARINAVRLDQRNIPIVLPSATFSCVRAPAAPVDQAHLAIFPSENLRSDVVAESPQRPTQTEGLVQGLSSLQTPSEKMQPASLATPQTTWVASIREMTVVKKTRFDRSGTIEAFRSRTSSNIISRTQSYF